MSLLQMDIFEAIGAAEHNTLILNQNTAFYGSAVSMLQVDFTRQPASNSSSFVERIRAR